MQKNAYDKMLHPHTMKTLSRLAIEENFLNWIKLIYKKLIVNTILND